MPTAERPGFFRKIFAYTTNEVVMMSKRMRLLVVVGILALVGAGGGVALQTGTPSPPPPAPVPRAVRVQEVASEAATSGQTYTGVGRARYETDLAFRVGGKI